MSIYTYAFQSNMEAIFDLPETRIPELSDSSLRTFLREHISESGVEGLMKGFVHSEATRKKMSASSKGKPKSASHRANIAKAKVGIPRSEETKRRVSESKKGSKWSTEAKIKRSKTITGCIWIYKDNDVKRVTPKDFSKHYESLGWLKGRGKSSPTKNINMGHNRKV